MKIIYYETSYCYVKYLFFYTFIIILKGGGNLPILVAVTEIFVSESCVNFLTECSTRLVRLDLKMFSLIINELKKHSTLL